MDRPENVATPFTAATVLVPDNVPPPGFVPIPNVTDDESVVTVLPAASCTVTFGCCANATPPVEVPGCVENTSFDATPTAMSNGALVAVVRPPLVAVSVYPVPPLSILQPAKASTPATAFFGFVVHVSVPPPGFVPIASVIDAVLPVTVFPPASCTMTTGCCDQADPPAPPPGCVVNASFAAAPDVMLNVLLVAPVSAPSVAVNV